MTLAERYNTLTPEQREKLNMVKTAGQLDEFLNEGKLELSDEEKGQILDIIKEGTLPSSNEELDDVAGGLERPPHLHGSVVRPRRAGKCG